MPLVLLAAYALGRATAPRSATHPTQVAMAAGSEEKFAFLSQARSNSCGLVSSEIAASFPDTERIQGSCCSAMDLHRYQEQVEGLTQYADIPQVPDDPYDIPVRLAKELIGYQSEVTLTEDEQRTYDQALRLSEEGGPCCCRCWRWDAFDGLARLLIRERGFDAQEVARLWNLLDGCGGSGHLHEFS